MNFYKDPHLQVKNHRLSLFERGIKYAASIELLSSNPSKVTLQQRNIFQRCLAQITHSKATYDVLYLNEDFCELPLLLHFYTSKNENLRFFINQSISNIKVNNLVKDISKDIVYGYSDDLDYLYSEFRKARGLKLIIIGANFRPVIDRVIVDLKHLKPMLFLIPNYSRAEISSLYFYLQKKGMEIFEHVDGLGEVVTPVTIK